MGGTKPPMHGRSQLSAILWRAMGRMTRYRDDRRSRSFTFAPLPFEPSTMSQKVHCDEPRQRDERLHRIEICNFDGCQITVFRRNRHHAAF
jgi:hypothetical protein